MVVWVLKMHVIDKKHQNLLIARSNEQKKIVKKFFEKLENKKISKIDLLIARSNEQLLMESLYNLHFE